MKRYTVSLDANGQAIDCHGGRVQGLRVVPGRPAGASSRPGAYPVTVQFRGGRRWPILNGTAVMFGDVEAAQLSGFNLVDGESGDTWCVTVFEARDEAEMPGGQRGSVVVPVQAATAIPTAVPSLATDGYKVRPGTRAHTFYASGTLATARLWVRSAAGGWYDTGDDLDFATNPVQSRQVLASGDRVYLRGPAATMNIEVDAEVEVE